MPVTEIIDGALYQSDASSSACERVLARGVRRVLLIDLCGIDRSAIPSSPEITYVRWPIDDAGMPERSTLALITAFATNWIATGGAVVSMCEMGMNRSGLLAAAVAARVNGISGAEAARLVRSKNSSALHNDAFWRYLAEEL